MATRPKRRKTNLGVHKRRLSGADSEESTIKEIDIIQEDAEAGIQATAGELRMRRFVEPPAHTGHAPHVVHAGRALEIRCRG